MTATAGGRSANFGLQVQPGIADTLVLTAPLPATVRAGDTITFPAFQLADRFMNPVRLAGAEVLAFGRFTVASEAGVGDGRVSVKTDSSGKATLPPLINRGPVGQSHIQVLWNGFVPVEIPEPNGSSAGLMGIGGTTFRPW